MDKENLIHLHTKEIKIESSVISGTAELSIKMKVKYP